MNFLDLNSQDVAFNQDWGQLLIEQSLPVWMYFVFLGGVALQRLWETQISKLHERDLKARGAYEVSPGHFPLMVLVHCGWLVCCAVEAYSQKQAPSLFLSVFFTLIFFTGQVLRLLAMKTLGPRWTVRILVLPREQNGKETLVTNGIYRYIRHPNYFGVILEIFSLPLIFGLWKTALIFSILNALVLWIRIQAEEKGLNTDGEYAEAFYNKITSHR